MNVVAGYILERMERSAGALGPMVSIMESPKRAMVAVDFFARLVGVGVGVCVSMTVTFGTGTEDGVGAEISPNDRRGLFTDWFSCFVSFEKACSTSSGTGDKSIGSAANTDVINIVVKSDRIYILYPSYTRMNTKRKRVTRVL